MKGPARKPPRSPDALFDLALRAPIIGGAILLPFVISHGMDVFRYPKELVFRGEGILAAAVIAIFFVISPGRLGKRLAGFRFELALVAAALAWTALTTALSTNRAISVESLSFVAVAVVVFVATIMAAQTWRSGAIIVVLVPAIATSVIALLQRFEIWSPIVFEADTPLRIRTAATLGNPNDVGCYLVAPILLSTVMALLSRGRPRLFYSATLLVLAMAMAATETLTAIGAVGVGLFLVALLRWRSASLRVVLATVVVGCLIFVGIGPLRERIRLIAAQSRSGEYVHVTSNRIPAFIAAWTMFRDHPLTGTGPGTFHFWYMPYKVQINNQHPKMIDAVNENFGHVHNDHLELLAAAGIPAYALFLAALALLGSISFRGSSEGTKSREQEVAGLCALPLSASILVLTLAQFPLELAAVLSVLIHTSALCVAWRHP